MLIYRKAKKQITVTDIVPKLYIKYSHPLHATAKLLLIHITRFLPRDAMHPRYQPWACVRLCLCPCLSQAGVLLKRQNVGSHKQHHTIAQDSSFLMPKISAKFDRGHPLRGCQMQVGWVKIGDFRQISGYISKTVKDRHTFSIKVEQEVVCALSNGDIAVDLECPLTTPNHPIFCISHCHSQLRNG